MIVLNITQCLLWSTSGVCDKSAFSLVYACPKQFNLNIVIVLLQQSMLRNNKSMGANCWNCLCCVFNFTLSLVTHLRIVVWSMNVNETLWPETETGFVSEMRRRFYKNKSRDQLNMKNMTRPTSMFEVNSYGKCFTNCMR